MVIDYYFVRKGYLEIRDLYNAERDGAYYGVFGFQWRGYVAYICGIVINVVGFAGAVGTDVPIGATYIYRLNFFAGFIVSGIVYYSLCRLFPVPALSPTGRWFEVGDRVRNPSLVYGSEVNDIVLPHTDTEQGVTYGEKKWWNLKSHF